MRALAAESASEIPPPEEWPEPPTRTEAGDVLTDVIIATFQLDGRLMDVARRLDISGRSTMKKGELVSAIKKENRRVSAKNR